jgi:hypothetical protein
MLSVFHVDGIAGDGPAFSPRRLLSLSNPRFAAHGFTRKIGRNCSASLPRWRLTGAEKSSHGQSPIRYVRLSMTATHLCPERRRQNTLPISRRCLKNRTNIDFASGPSHRCDRMQLVSQLGRILAHRNVFARRSGLAGRQVGWQAGARTIPAVRETGTRRTAGSIGAVKPQDVSWNTRRCDCRQRNAAVRDVAGRVPACLISTTATGRQPSRACRPRRAWMPSLRPAPPRQLPSNSCPLYRRTSLPGTAQRVPQHPKP